MQPVDAAGLPNRSTGRNLRLRVCPVCGEEAPQGAAVGGVTWKWLASHFAGHLGWEWTSEGWATINRNQASSTTTRSDER